MSRVTVLRMDLANPAIERLPLLITLRNFTKATSARELINDALTEQYQVHFVGAPYEVFEELNRRGKILLILDARPRDHLRAGKTSHRK